MPILLYWFPKPIIFPQQGVSHIAVSKTHFRRKENTWQACLGSNSTSLASLLWCAVHLQKTSNMFLENGGINLKAPIEKDRHFISLLVRISNGYNCSLTLNWQNTHGTDMQEVESHISWKREDQCQRIWIDKNPSGVLTVFLLTGSPLAWKLSVVHHSSFSEKNNSRTLLKKTPLLLHTQVCCKINLFLWHKHAEYLLFQDHPGKHKANGIIHPYPIWSEIAHLLSASNFNYKLMHQEI